MSDTLCLELVIPESLNPQAVNVRVSGTNEHPLFCLADVCKVLGIGNIGNVADRLDNDEKTYIRRADVGLTPGRDVVFVTEAGLYTVLLRSDKPQAKPFRKWVTTEVLPSIRKHGCYPPPVGGTVAKRQPMSLHAIRDMVDKMIEHDEELEAIRIVQVQQAHDIEEAKALAAASMDCHTSNYGYYSILAFSRLKGANVDLKEASVLGVRATALCRRRGLEIGTVRDPRFGTVNTYPESILEELWASRE